MRDLGIQVMVEPPNPKNAASLSAQRQADIQKILGTVVRTSLDKNETQNQNLTDNDINNKIVVSVQPFDGKTSLNTDSAQSSGLPIWVYITGGVLLAAIILLIILLIRKKRSQEDEYEEYEYETLPEPVRLPDINEEKIETEETVRRKQLEKWLKKNRKTLLNCFEAGWTRIRGNGKWRNVIRTSLQENKKQPSS